MVYPKLVLSQITPVSIRQQLLETGMDMKAWINYCWYAIIFANNLITEETINIIKADTL